MNGLALALIAVGLHSPLAGAAEVVLMPSVEVIGTTPLSATGVPLSQFPANAQTLKASAIGEQGTSNLADLMNNNLGPVSISDGTGNPYQNDVNYRGFQATSVLGAPVGLSTYFDGVRVNEPFGSIVNWDLIPMNAISNVEVLPGSNPMFGLNTLGGALVVNTKNGKENAGTSIGVTGGSFNRRAVSVETGWVDEAHGTDYFVAGNDDRQDGFRDHSGSEVRQLFGKARWQGNGGRTGVEFSTALANTRLSGTQSLPMDMMGNPGSAYTWPDRIDNRAALFNFKASHWLNDNNQLAGNLYYRNAHSGSTNSNAALDDGCFDANGDLVVSGSAYKCGNKAPDGTSVNSVTGANALALGYGRWTSSINTSLIASATQQDTVGTSAQWSNFDNLLGHRNAFTLGGSVDRSKIGYRQDTYLARLIGYQTVVIPNQEYGFTANGLAPSASNLPAFTGSNLLSSVDLSSTTRNFSLYFTDTFDVTQKLNVTASGSFSETSLDQSGANNQYLNGDGGYSWTDSVTGVSYYNPAYAAAFKYSNSGTGAATTSNGAPAGYVAGPQTNGLDGTHHYHRFNPAIGFNYNFDAANGLFGGYSESMRAPTSIELSCADPNSPCALPTGFNGDPDLKAVVARTVEFGARGRLGGNVSWNAAVYDSRLQNDIQFIATSSTYGYFSNVGDTERRGVEIGAQAKLDRLFLSANYGYVNATYQSAFTTAGGANVASGNRIPGIPAQTLKMRAAWSVTPDLLVGGNLILVGSQYAHGNEDNSDPAGKVPGYGLMNLDVHYRLGKDLQASLNVNNLFNRQYSTYGLSGMTSIYTLTTQNFFTPAPPRAVWVGLSYSFGGKAAGKADRD